ncbi:MAG: Sporulation kinase E [Pelotomaculum sp. PtaB.Bin104]|nr:MAG: Sporulation kinase E [Pelotomaculum sp. PtaB.Bin104]
MTRFSIYSLRTRLLLIILSAVLPALGLILYTAAEQRQMTLVQVQERALQLVRVASNDQERLIEGAHQFLTIVSQLPEVRSGDSASCSMLLADLLKQNPIYANIALFNLDGTLQCSAVPIPIGGTSQANRAYFQRVLEIRDFVIGDYHISRTNGKPSLYLGYPVLNKAGQVQAVLVTVLDLAWLNQLAAEAALPPGTTLTVIDQNGTVLASYPDPEKWVGESMSETPIVQTVLNRQDEGTAGSTDTDDIMRFYAFRPLYGAEGGADVYIYIGIPAEVIFAGVNRLLARSLAGLGLVTVLVLVIGWVGGNIFLMRRLNALLGATQRLASGNLSARTGLPHEQGEFGQLAHSFDKMAEALEQRNAQLEASKKELEDDITIRKRMEDELRKHRDHLEELVKERTDEIKATNEHLLQEITERRQAEVALRVAQQQLQDILEFLPDPTFVINRDKKVIAWNRAMEEMTGVRQEDIIGKSGYVYGAAFYGKPRPILIDLIFSDEKEIEEQYTNIKKKDNKVFAEAFVPLTYGGEGAYLWGVASPLYDCMGNLIGAIESIRDFTEQMMTVEALRLSEERFSKAFNASPNAMFIKTFSDGRCIDVNNSFLSVFGYSRQEVIGRTTIDLNIYVEPEDRAKIIQIVMEQGVSHNLEVNFRMKSGEVRVGLLSADIVELGGKRCILGVINDITERRQLEKEIARLDQLSLVGEMAAGFAHEIRNPMTTVRGFLQIYRSKKHFEQYKEYFNLMIEELDRANSIITEYLSIAKNNAVELKLQNLNLIVEALSPLIVADAMNSDRFVNVKLADIPDLLLDEKDIRQLILNIVRNGLEAMPIGGNLTIRTFMDKEEVILSVQDQGEGIKPDVLEKIGTPFFTTKDYGTGLGLAVCYGIAARHNAKIKVETSANGTTFLVQFKKCKSLAS